LYAFKYGDCAYGDHIRWSPDCPYIIRVFYGEEEEYMKRPAEREELQKHEFTEHEIKTLYRRVLTTSGKSIPSVEDMLSTYHRDMEIEARARIKNTPTTDVNELIKENRAMRRRITCCDCKTEWP
jgi:hypothetical protein